MIALLVVSCNKNGVSNKPLKTELDSLSYAIGMFSANNVKASFTEFDNDLFIQGYMNAYDSTNVLIEEGKVQQIIQTYIQNQKQENAKKQQAEALKKAEEKYGKNKVAGEVFLAENISKEGVETTESGLQYIVLKEGNGDAPVATSRVKVHYHGTRIDGTVFDSSVDRGKPTEFAVNQVISGWTEGLQLMKIGSKYKFFIPQELAYGATPRPGVIKPFDALIFEVELLEILK